MLYRSEDLQQQIAFQSQDATMFLITLSKVSALHKHLKCEHMDRVVSEVRLVVMGKAQFPVTAARFDQSNHQDQESVITPR